MESPFITTDAVVNDVVRLISFGGQLVPAYGILNLDTGDFTCHDLPAPNNDFQTITENDFAIKDGVIISNLADVVDNKLIRLLAKESRRHVLAKIWPAHRQDRLTASGLARRVTEAFVFLQGKFAI